MKAETLRNELAGELVDFAWTQWSQLGVAVATPTEREERAIDPEALLLFTLEVGRYDPRLFDEVLDWTAENEPLVSVQRLRNLCADDEDRALADGMIAWVAAARSRGRGDATSVHPTLRALFRSMSAPSANLDPAFARHGFARSRLTRSGKSQAPRLDEPISFALRLRRLLGRGARAEIMRALLTIRAPWLSGRVITASAQFAQRNVREGLTALHEAGVVDVTEVGGERQYSTDVRVWAQLLGYERASQLPFHHHWVPNLRALTQLLRWLSRPDLDELSPYMRASEARTLVQSLDADLRYARVVPEIAARPGADYWDEFVAMVRATAKYARKPA